MGLVASLCESNNHPEPSATAKGSMDQTYVIQKSVLDALKTSKPNYSGKLMTPEDFRVIRVLGKGSYGKVYLVEHKEKHKYYALKCFKKNNILVQNLLERVLSEKNILKELKHPFVVRLKYAFQNKTKVYLAMDFCQGGDLNTLLAHRKKFNEDEVRFYASEIILALQYIHEKLNIVHRDMKPENIMFCADGHIKLTDFGLAKVTRKTFSLCGTPEYVAPEVITGEGHGKEVDWWGLGCTIYELLTGYSPFVCKNREQMPLNILTKDPSIPEQFSKPAKDLILKLLVKEPKQRLGANGIDEIKKHDFFKGVDWSKVLLKNQIPPFVPTLDGKEDTRYFMETPYEKSTPQTAEGSMDNQTTPTPEGDIDFPAFSYVDNESIIGSPRRAHTRNVSEIGEKWQIKTKTEENL